MAEDFLDNPLDFPMALGRMGDMSVWLAPDDEDRPVPVVLSGPGEGMIQSMVPLAQKTLEADQRRLLRARRRASQQEQDEEA